MPVIVLVPSSNPGASIVASWSSITDVALAPKGGHFDAGRAANALLRARLTDFGEGAALYDERVRIVAV